MANNGSNRFENIVSMTFDNAAFQKGVSETLQSLAMLKAQSNDIDAKGFANLELALNKINNRFSLLGNTVQSVFRSISNTVVRAGKKIVDSLTIEFPKEGLAEYNMQIGSVQTIMANTGRSVDDVNAALDELNAYADKTIYNFSQMTHNAGLFTAAIGNQQDALEKSTKALKGIGNWAAYAGTDATTMARATYQLSQAAASGSIRLMDWRSIENAGGMAGANYKQEFITTAEEMGAIKKGQITLENFRDSLKDGWLSADVFFKTMEKFADNEAMTDAATKVKTFTQLIDTLKEALGSGWAQSWRIVVGDFEEAKEFWTRWNDVLSKLIGESSDARNSILTTWDTMGGRTMLIDTMFHSFNILANIIGAVKKSFTDVFSPVTSKNLIDITRNIKSMVYQFEKFLKTSSFLPNLNRLFRGLFSILGIGVDIIKAFGSGIKTMINDIVSSNSGIIEIVLSFADYINSVYEAKTVTEDLNKIIQSLSKFLAAVANVVLSIATGIIKFVPGLGKIISFIKDAVSDAIDTISNADKASSAVSGIGAGIESAANKIDSATTKINSFMDVINSVFNWISSKMSSLESKFAAPIETVGNIVKNAIGRVVSAFSTLTSTDWNVALGSGGLIGAILLLNSTLDDTSKKSNFVERTLSEVFGGILKPINDFLYNIGIPQLTKSVSGFLDTLSNSLANLGKSVKAEAMISIGKALLMMAGAMVIMSTIDAGGLAIGLSGLFLMSQMLSLVFKQMLVALEVWKNVDPATLATIPLSIAAITQISKALLLLAVAVKILTIGDMGKTIIGFGLIIGAMAMMMHFIKKMQVWMGNAPKQLNDAIKGITAIARSILILAVAIKIVAAGDIFKTMAAWGMVELMLISLMDFIKKMQVWMGAAPKKLKDAIGGIMSLSIALLLISGAIKILASGDIFNNLAAFGMIELILVTLFVIIDKLTSKQIDQNGTKKLMGAMLVMALGISSIGKSLSKVASNNWKQILAAGLAISGVMVVLTGIFVALDKLKIDTSKMLLASAAISIVSVSMVALAGSLAILSALGDGVWTAMAAAGVAIVGLTLGLAALGTLITSTGMILGLGALVLALAALAGVAKGFGSAMLAIGEGLAVIAAAIGALAVIDPSTVSSASTNLAIMLGAMLSTVVSFIPAFVTGVVAGFIDAITKMALSIATAILNQIESILDLLNERLPTVIVKLNTLLTSVITGVMEFINTVIEPVVAFILGCLVTVLNAMADWFDDESNAAALQDSIYNFASSIGEILGGALKTFIGGAFKGAVSGIGKLFGIEDAWGDYMTYMPDFLKPDDPKYREMTEMAEESGEGLGENLTQGYANGISQNGDDVSKAAANLGKGAINSIAEAQDSHSPSKEAYKLGNYVDMGYSEGISDNSDKVEESATDLGDGLLGTLGNCVSNLLDDQKDFQNDSLTSYKDYAGNMEAESKRLSEALAKNTKSSIRKETKIEGAQWQIDHGYGKEVDHYYETRIHQEASGYTWRDEIEVDEKRYAEYVSKIEQLNAEAKQNTVKETRKASEEEIKAAKEKLKKMVDDVKDAYKEYTDAQDSAKEDLKNKGGIFDAVDWGFDPENPVTKETLKKNLEDQIAQVRRYNAAMASLNDKITNEELKKTIESMGVDKLEELEVLDTMSEGELDQYESLFADKMAEAVEGSFYKTEAALNEMGAKVNKTLGTNLSTDEIIGVIGDEFGGEVDENTIKTLAELGGNLTQGILDGMTSDEAKSEITDSAEELLGPDGEVVEAEQIAADINSPSKVMRDEVGVYLLEGILEGMNDENAAKRIQYVVTMLTAWIVNKFREQADNYAYIGEMLNYNIANGMLQSADAISNALNSTIDSAKDSMNLVVSAAGKSLASKSSSPVIKPVINDKSLNDYNNSMMTSLSGQRSFMLANQANASMSTEINKTIKVDNGNVIAAINRLDSDLLAVGERVNSLQVRLDSGALVGQIAPQMNSALGMTALRTGRYGG